MRFPCTTRHLAIGPTAAVALCALGLTAGSAAATTITATASNGVMALEGRNTGTVSVTTAPAGGLGTDALEFTTGAGAAVAGGPGGVYGKGGKGYASVASMIGTKFSDLTQLTYSAYVQSPLSSDVDVSLNIPADFDGDGNWDHTLVWEPSHQVGTTVAQSTWQNFDALGSGGGWWVTPGTTACPTQCNATLASALGPDFATAKISGPGVEASGQPFPGGVILVDGQRATPSSWDNFDGFADDLTIRVGTDAPVTYDAQITDPATVTPTPTPTPTATPTPTPLAGSEQGSYFSSAPPTRPLGVEVPKPSATKGFTVSKKGSARIIVQPLSGSTSYTVSGTIRTSGKHSRLLGKFASRRVPQGGARGVNVALSKAQFRWLKRSPKRKLAITIWVRSVALDGTVTTTPYTTTLRLSRAAIASLTR